MPPAFVRCAREWPESATTSPPCCRDVEVQSVEASTVDTPEAPVLVGTEAVLHRVGRDGPPVGVVAYLELDQELLAPRFALAEQALWLLMCGAGSWRRDRCTGELLVQTRLPDHEVVRRSSTPRRWPSPEPSGHGARSSGSHHSVVSPRSAANLPRWKPRARHCETVEACRSSGRSTTANAHSCAAPSWNDLADALATPAVDAARALGRLRLDVDPRRSA